MSRIELREIRKVYPTGVVAVDGLDLSVDDGEVLVLLGPTGCGKSTVLRLIAGLETPTAGEVRFDGASMQDVAPRERGVALVFQDHSLYPHLTVAGNIGFPLAGLDESLRSARVLEVARLLGLDTMLHRRPSQLSGGQRQRLAMARAIVRTPRALLMDQPLASLDAGAREAVRADILDLIHRLGVATVYVTHDHVEALLFADRVAVMRRGRIEQVGTPAEIYADPRCLFVAAFVGSPRMNLLQAAVYAEPEVRVVVDLGPQALYLPWDDPRARALAGYHSARITLGVRPDAVHVTGGSGHQALRGVVRSVQVRGYDALVHVETGCAPTPYEISHLDYPDAPGELSQITAERLPRQQPVRERLLRLVPQRRPEATMRYAFQPAYDPDQHPARQASGDLAVRMSAAAAPQPGDTLQLTMDLDQIYLFDGAGDRIHLPPARRVSASQPA